MMLGALVVFVADTSCGNSCPEVECPATYLGISLDVTAPDAGAVAAAATLSGPAAVTMSCHQSGATTVCMWPGGAPVTAGTYSLQVTAPGFQTANVSVTVTTSSADGCGCPGASMQPSTVTLEPS